MFRRAAALVMACAGVLLVTMPAGAQDARAVADLKVSLDKLESLSAEAEVIKDPADTTPERRKMNLFFKKPFAVAVKNATPAEKGSTGGAELYYGDGKAVLYFPDGNQMVKVDVGSGDSTVEQFFNLFTIDSFVQGLALKDIESHFETKLVTGKEGQTLRLTVRESSVYRWALGLTKLEATLDPKTNLPVRVSMFDGNLELVRMNLDHIQYNQPIDAAVFRFVPPAGVRELDAYGVLLMWVKESLQQSRSGISPYMDHFEGQMQDYMKGPWVPR